MMTMMMVVVVVVREDASIFISRRRWRLVICLTFIRIFSKDTLMMMVVIVGERRSRLFTIDGPLVWLIHSNFDYTKLVMFGYKLLNAILTEMKNQKKNTY